MEETAEHIAPSQEKATVAYEHTNSCLLCENLSPEHLTELSLDLLLERRTTRNISAYYTQFLLYKTKKAGINYFNLVRHRKHCTLLNLPPEKLEELNKSIHKEKFAKLYNARFLLKVASIDIVDEVLRHQLERMAQVDTILQEHEHNIALLRKGIIPDQLEQLYSSSLPIQPYPLLLQEENIVLKQIAFQQKIFNEIQQVQLSRANIQRAIEEFEKEKNVYITQINFNTDTMSGNISQMVKDYYAYLCEQFPQDVGLAITLSQKLASLCDEKLNPVISSYKDSIKELLPG